MKVTQLYMKALGDHPLNKYLWLLDNKNRVIVGKQIYQDDNYFQSVFEERIEYYFMHGLKGWLGELDGESIKSYRLL
mgnify:FL=1